MKAETTEMPMSPSGSRLESLTSLRLGAALVVVVQHSKGFVLPDSINVPVGEAVSFFFVLSGFILTYAYYGRKYSLKNYYLARAARIIPAALLSILTYIVLVNPAALNTTSSHPFIAASNFFLLQSLIPIPVYYFALNAVLWSVSVEVFFYAFFPQLQCWLKKTSGRIALIAFSLVIGFFMVALAYCFPGHSSSTLNDITWEGMIYINPLSRLKEFAIGMLAAGVFIKLREKYSALFHQASLLTFFECLGICALIWGLPVISQHSIQFGAIISPSPPIFAVFINQAFTAVLFALIIVVFAIQGGLLSRIFRASPLVIGGEISFSVYLFHQIIILWQNKNPWLLGWCSPLWRFWILLLFTLVVSYVIWRWFECPMRSLIRRACAKL